MIEQGGFLPMAKKIKLSEAAKELQLPAKELAAFLEEHSEGKKTSSSSVTEPQRCSA